MERGKRNGHIGNRRRSMFGELWSEVPIWFKIVYVGAIVGTVVACGIIGWAVITLVSSFSSAS